MYILIHSALHSFRRRYCLLVFRFSPTVSFSLLHSLFHSSILNPVMDSLKCTFSSYTQCARFHWMRMHLLCCMFLNLLHIAWTTINQLPSFNCTVFYCILSSIYFYLSSILPFQSLLPLPFFLLSLSFHRVFFSLYVVLFIHYRNAGTFHLVFKPVNSLLSLSLALIENSS